MSQVQILPPTLNNMGYIVFDRVTHQTLKRYGVDLSPSKWEWGDNYTDMWDETPEDAFIVEDSHRFVSKKEAQAAVVRLAECFRGAGTPDEEIDFEIIQVEVKRFAWYQRVQS